MDDVLASLPGYALRRASTAMQLEFAALLAPLGLRPSDASILVLIDANPGMSPGAIGQALGIQRANMVPLVARLETSGYLTRVEVDGRSFGLNLSHAGEHICRQVKDAMAEHQRLIFERIPPQHRDHLIPALKALWL
ncbi:MAG: MarR family winged helix-turn-helix transcriptional regulator [Sphingomonadaceae bacterium]